MLSAYFGDEDDRNSRGGGAYGSSYGGNMVTVENYQHQHHHNGYMQQQHRQGQGLGQGRGTVVIIVRCALETLLYGRGL